MLRPKIKFYGLVLALFCFLVSCGQDSNKSKPKPVVKKTVINKNVEAMNLRSIKMAVDVVEMTLGSMQDGGGYQEWTPKKAVEKLIPTLNSASKPLPGEPKMRGTAARIKYVKDKVTEAYQIVLTPNDEKKLIYIKGYGKDITNPAYTKEIKVSRY